MGWPVISEVVAALKGEPASPEAEPKPVAPAPTEPAPAATAEPTADQEPASEPAATDEPQTETTPADPTALIVAAIAKEASDPETRLKNAKAFLATLPADVRELIREVEYPTLHKTLSASRAETARAQQENAALITAIDQRIQERFDEIATAGMSDEDKKVWKDTRELDQRRKAEAEPKAPVQDVATAIKSSPVFSAFWQTVKDAGLPMDPSDPGVRQVWASAMRVADPEAAIATMRATAEGFRKKPDPKPEPDIKSLVESRAAELVEAKLDERLKKMGIAKADSGRPGASGGSPSRPITSWDEAARAAVEDLRRANAST